jgi:diguanylate cyclase (GGDEF)-like protein
MNAYEPSMQSKILIVDDDPGTVRVLAQILKALGKVYVTTHSQDAVTLAQSTIPDIILLDIEMPEQDGFAVCEQLIADPVLKDVPILFVTARDDLETEARALRTCALDFIHKPPHPEIVRARVSNYLMLKHQRDRLRRLSLTDGLTGIANRRAFDQAIVQEWRRACRRDTPLLVLLLDVDEFKAFNDTHGHQMGDACLRAIATVLERNTKRPGDMAARYGGEEFALLLPDCSFTDGLQIAEQIRRQVAALHVSNDADERLAGPITISIGVAVSDQLSTQDSVCGGRSDTETDLGPRDINPRQLIESADQALYKAKRSGRNQVQPPYAHAPRLPAPEPGDLSER